LKRLQWPWSEGGKSSPLVRVSRQREDPMTNERRCHPALAQTRHESDGLPVSVRRVADQTLASRTAASQPHWGGGAGLVDKHQSCGVKHALFSHPTSARADHPGTLLFFRVQSFS
jgi:hypothetical protein